MNIVITILLYNIECYIKYKKQNTTTHTIDSKMFIVTIFKDYSTHVKCCVLLKKAEK